MNVKGAMNVYQDTWAIVIKFTTSKEITGVISQKKIVRYMM